MGSTRGLVKGSGRAAQAPRRITAKRRWVDLWSLKPQHADAENTMSTRYV